MPEGYQRDSAANVFPTTSLNMWRPFFSGTLQATAQAQKVCGAIAGEWQTFLMHRLQEDVRFIQRVTRISPPDQILAAYSEFWQNAAEDYRKQLATVTKLLANVPGNATAMSQTTADKASATELRSQKAA